MGYTLEFYSADVKQLHDAIIQPEKSNLIQQAFVDEWGKLYSSPSTSQQIWEQAINSLALSFNGNPNHHQQITASESVGLALSALIRQCGFFVGSLNHPSAGGNFFRDDFLKNIAGQYYGYPALAESLTARSLYGLNAEAYPSWGFLTQEELSELAIDPDDADNIEDDELAIYFEELTSIMEEMIQRKQDCLTLYL